MTLGIISKFSVFMTNDSKIQFRVHEYEYYDLKTGSNRRYLPTGLEMVYWRAGSPRASKEPPA